MNESQENELYYYSSCYKIPYDILRSTFLLKRMDYINRDLKLGKTIEWYGAYQQGERALMIMEEYLAKEARKG